VGILHDVVQPRIQPLWPEKCLRIVGELQIWGLNSYLTMIVIYRFELDDVRLLGVL
jgi:hypothetical protein